VTFLQEKENKIQKSWKKSIKKERRRRRRRRKENKDEPVIPSFVLV